MKEILNDVLYMSVIIAFVAAFVVLLLKKWCVVEWMQVHGSKFFYQLFSCDFCLSFWTCVILSIVMAFVCWDFTLLVCPFVACPIIRMLV